MAEGRDEAPSAAELAAFENEDLRAPAVREAHAEAALAEARTQDARWRIHARPFVCWGFSLLLLVQNAAVITLVAYLAAAGTLSGASNFLIALSAGTLGETAVIVRIIVKWVFSDIDYARRR